MLEGWDRQQRSRFLRESTVKPRLDLVRRFATFTGLYPWQWTPAELEAFTDPANLFGLHWSSWFWPHLLQSRAASREEVRSPGVGPNPVARRRGGAKCG